MTGLRKIIHIDMDAFYASVEQRDAPNLRGKPVAVGYAGKRGVVMTASYEARRFGIGSAMPSVIAVRRCPELIFVEPRRNLYKAISEEIHEIFKLYTDLVEPLALDEAYLDVTDPKKGPASGTLIADLMKRDVYTQTKLTASAGVAANKFLAKLASGQNKPDGLTVILPKEAQAFIAQLPIEAFHGVGKVTAARMHELGIHTGHDLRKQSEERLVSQFGKHGKHFWQIARGQDERPVEPNRPYKSISSETTFTTDLDNKAELVDALGSLCEHVAKSLMEHDLTAVGVFIKVKYANHQIRTRRQTLPHSIYKENDIRREATKLITERLELSQSVRLLGVGVFELRGANEPVMQASLF